jgi:vacuolar protein sorting-associated protein 8
VLLSTPPPPPPLRVHSPVSLPGTPSRLSKPFLHPNVSRLRSYTPQASSEIPHSTTNTSFGLISPSASHLSALSRMSSLSNIHQAASESDKTPSAEAQHGHAKEQDREVFRWTELRNIAQSIYSPPSPAKATSVLGRNVVGSPTTLVANGLICIGTDEGRVWVFDFKQNLKCVCGESTGVILPTSFHKLRELLTQ